MQTFDFQLTLQFYGMFPQIIKSRAVTHWAEIMDLYLNALTLLLSVFRQMFVFIKY